MKPVYMFGQGAYADGYTMYWYALSYTNGVIIGYDVFRKPYASNFGTIVDNEYLKAETTGSWTYKVTTKKPCLRVSTTDSIPTELPAGTEQPRSYSEPSDNAVVYIFEEE